MNSYEIMLSESQERMLLVAEKGREQEVIRVFEKWGLDAVIIGVVAAEERLRITDHGTLVADIPNRSLTDDAPVYHRPVGTWTAPVPQSAPQDWNFTRPRNALEDLRTLLATANICDKRWVYEQYDSMVQTNTVQGPGSESGLMRIKGTTRGLAMALDGNSRWCYLDPKLGASHAVAEAARKVACTGATPVAATNCLNFGNPEKPEIMAQLSNAIDGLREACLALGTPITGGNVSLYNETRGEGIYPTPVVGIVGNLDDISLEVPSDFISAGYTVLLLRAAESISNEDEVRRFGSSEFARTIIGSVWGAPPALTLELEAALHRCLAQLASEKTLHSARDVSDGGLTVALAEACFGKGIGVRAELPTRNGCPIQCSLFAEHASNVIVSCVPENTDRVKGIAASHGLEAITLGSTINQRFEILLEGKLILADEVRALRNIWSSALPQMLAVAN